MSTFWKQLRTPRGKALLAMLASLLFLVPAWYFLTGWYQANLIQQERAKAAEQISAHANALTMAVDQRIALLQGLYAFTRTEWPDTTFDRPFEVYSAGVYFNSTGLRTLMIAPEGIARYIFPISDASLLSGYDILNDPNPAVRDDVQRAIHNQGITLSQPGQLRQGGFGLNAWQAVYRGSDLWGLVAIAIDMNTVLKDAGLSGLSSDLNMALRDNLGYTFFGTEDVWKHEPLIQTISLPEGTWDLGGIPTAGWQAAVQPQMQVFRLGSLLIGGLIAVLVYLSFNRQGQLAQAVAQRTRELTAAQQVLEQRVAERTHELSTLLDVSRRIGSTLDLDPLLESILTEIKPVLDYTWARIYRLDENGDLVQASSANGRVLQETSFSIAWLDAIMQNDVMKTLQPKIGWDWSPNPANPKKICWMGVPLVIKDQATGLLVFLHKDPHFYTDEHARLALAFAQQVAVAIENARLYEQAGQLAVLEERQRLARELHDSVSQVLYSIGLGAKTARATLQRNPSQISEALEYVDRLAEAGQVEMRSLIFELRPESLQTDGLVAALEKQAAVLRTRHQVDVHTQFCPEPDIPLNTKEILYRISQEATHNIAKHAHASQVTINLQCTDDQIRLEICDNGVGFDPSTDFPGHLGLKSMRERAIRCQGEVQIESAPGRGTNIRFAIPLKKGNNCG
jgi:signal transduction histidine kinase